MLKVGLVGTGFISDEHVLGYRGCADAEIVAVCDLDLGRARGWLERWRLPAARAYDGVERMLDGEKLDLVEILTPQTQHYAHVVQCAGAGVPFISVQKPMAVGIAQCDRMIEACRASDTVLRLYENYVFYPVYHEAKRLLDDGIIGALTSVRVHTIGGVRDGAPWPHFWVPVDVRQSRSSVLVGDDGLHKFSLACWLMDRDIERVSSWIDPETPLDAPAFIRAKFRARRGEPAKYAQIDFNFSTRLAIPSDVWLDDFVEICGERGVMWIHQCAGAGDRPLFKGNRMSSSQRLSAHRGVRGRPGKHVPRSPVGPGAQLVHVVRRLHPSLHRGGDGRGHADLHRRAGQGPEPLRDGGAALGAGGARRRPE